MKILKVIHGYPMRYNAGSEVYSQALCQELSNIGHDVQVFTREENPFKSNSFLKGELSSIDARILLNIVNLPLEWNRYQYCNPQVDQKFRQILKKFKPDIVHIGHLNHLSLTIIDQVVEMGLPIVYTLHDYWLMCPRGQFIQRNSGESLWPLCDGQDNQKCATKCYSSNFSGVPDLAEKEIEGWTQWVKNRMDMVHSLAKKVDFFIAPSQFLKNKYIEEFGIYSYKITYLDYGFDLKQLQNRQRQKGNEFTFGYIGTHIPAKGIHHLIEAFNCLKGPCRLKIWGRERPENTNSLKEIAKKFSIETQNRIEWLPEYTNESIVGDVFNHVDAIVVPSIWYENSPLVIHEAQQMRVPVITGNIGGMSEYVRHEVNGLLYEHRNVENLSAQMQRFVDNPKWASELGRRGYLFLKNRDIPSITNHVKELESIYTQLLKKKLSTLPPRKPGPWRITFDTNPDYCNLKCIMCEGFSPYSSVKKERIADERPRRRMDIKLIRKVLEESKGTPLREIIPSTMGEPLLYKHFEEIIAMCHEFHLKLNLTTNGTFPIKGAETWARLIVPVASDVKISWNGATKETQEKIMLHLNWEKVLSNLKQFIKIRDEMAQQGGNRASITLQLTFLKSNVHELSDIVNLGIDLGVDRIKGHHLWAHFDEIKSLSMRYNQETLKQWNQAAQKAIDIANSQRLPNGQKITLENIFLLSEEAIRDLTPGGGCPFLGKEAWINTEGRFSPCCAPDEQRLTLGDFGNIQNQTLSEIWTSQAYIDLRKTYPKKSLCIGCNMRKPLNTCEELEKYQ